MAEEQTQNTQAPAEEGRKPWVVAEIIGENEGFRIIQDGFKLQAEADDWIREHIGGVKLCSIRKGKAFGAVVKTTEVDF